MDIQDFLANLETLIETTDVECKAAQGRDRQGELPKSIWPSCSAMANTSGGDIYLGVEEDTDGSFSCPGIQDVQKVRKQFWDSVHNNALNKNIFSDQDVEVLTLGSVSIMHIHVPRATRQDRPVFLGAGNPFGNTYVRRHEGDYKADDETVRRMLAEAVEDSRDGRILENFGIDDLEADTIKAYRNLFSAIKPTSPWLEISTEDFLEKIGATGKDRETGKKGVRLAGLLMFGRYGTIKEVCPNYMVDYQERPEPKNELRWIDRVVPDDTWSGNLYDFYQKVIRRLVSDLKIPFMLRDGVRNDDTPIHQALREALTNTLIHADYSGRVSILVVKRPDMFGFRNPGLMRVPVDMALAGGISDCRNRTIQDLFRYVGLGDQAGSGIPSILRSWKSCHLRDPLLYEIRGVEQTLLELRTSSLLPVESIDHLTALFGERFRILPDVQRIALVTADVEGTVSHSRLKTLSTDHPKDLSVALATLVKEGFLEKHGETRAAVYSLKGFGQVSPFASEGLFFQEERAVSADNSPDLTPNSPDLTSNSPDLTPNSPDLKGVLGKALAEWGFNAMPGKLDSSRMEELILRLCREQWCTIQELSNVLERNPKALQDEYLTHMLAEGKLVLRYPEKNHPAQAYMAKNEEHDARP